MWNIDNTSAQPVKTFSTLYRCWRIIAASQYVYAICNMSVFLIRYKCVLVKLLEFGFFLKATFSNWAKRDMPIFTAHGRSVDFNCQPQQNTRLLSGCLPVLCNVFAYKAAKRMADEHAKQLQRGCATGAAGQQFCKGVKQRSSSYRILYIIVIWICTQQHAHWNNTGRFTFITCGKGLIRILFAVLFFHRPGKNRILASI